MYRDIDIHSDNDSDQTPLPKIDETIIERWFDGEFLTETEELWDETSPHEQNLLIKKMIVILFGLILLAFFFVCIM